MKQLEADLAAATEGEGGSDSASAGVLRAEVAMLQVRWLQVRPAATLAAACMLTSQPARAECSIGLVTPQRSQAWGVWCAGA